MTWSRCCGVAAVLTLLLAGGAGQASAADPTVGGAGVGDPYFPMDGNSGYDVGHYDVHIGYDPPSHHLDGSTTVHATATQPLSAFNLDFDGPPISRVLVNGTPANFDRNDAHELTVRPASLLLPGLPFTVQVDYAGKMGNAEGKGWTYTPTGGAVALGEPHSAATWYPVNDTPRDKATFTVETTVPSQWEVASGGHRVRDEITGGQRVVTWNNDNPTASYLTTVAIDKFDFLTQRRANGTEIISAIAPNSRQGKAQEQRVPEVLDFLESLYGPYPFDSAGGTHLSAPLSFALETETRPTYPVNTSINTVVHENTHQWWGDSQSVRSWSDICLNECFASYTGDYLWPERKEGVNVDALYRSQVAKAAQKPGFWAIPLDNPGPQNVFTSAYTRGPLFLHALRRQLGDQVFFPTMRDFVGLHKYGNASMAEFRQFVQLHSGTDLTGFLNAWLNGTTQPPNAYLFPAGLRG